MRQFDRYGPRISSRLQANDGVAALRHRVRRLEEREEDVLRKQWRLEAREKELEGIVEEVNAATTLNHEVQSALEAAEAKLVAREAELLARERACVDREEASRKREAASAMLDVQEAQTLVEGTTEWFANHMAGGGTDHFCEIVAAAEKAGHPSFAIYYSLAAYILDTCECEEEE